MSTTAAEPGPLGISGYRRADGRLGLRNHLLVLSTLALTNRVAQLAAAAEPGCLLVAGDLQRGLRGRDAMLQDRVVQALLRHPNVGGAVVFVHDTPARARLQAFADRCGRPVQVLAFMEGRGVAENNERGRRAIAEVRAALAAQPRSPGQLGELTVALECGGSDATSAVCANPTIGGFVDLVVASGGSAIVSETAEFIGAEAVVTARSASVRAGQDIVDAIRRRERLMQEDGEDYRGVNPTPENIAGGLSTLVEKSMGAVAKCGESPFMGRLDFAEAPPGPGLWFMDTPFFSPVSITGMLCGGAQLTLFGIGVFNPSAVPLAPTIRVCGNPATVHAWSDAIDIDVAALVDGRLGLPDAVTLLRQKVRAVCNGELTWAERWGEGQLIVPRECPSL
jgi:altronate dehydratase large subunit